MSRYKLLPFVVTIIFSCSFLSSMAAKSTLEEYEQIRSLYYEIHDKIESDSTVGAEIHDEVIDVLLAIMKEQPARLHGVGLTAAMEVANRLKTRSEMLDRISEVAYGHDFKRNHDRGHASWVFSLGIIEHARGDMAAATMWFDSTLTFMDQGLRNQTMGAAAKLLGYIEFDKKNFAAATEKFQLAKEIYTHEEVALSELIDINCSWASASILSGGDPEKSLSVSQKAVDRLDADLDLQKRWTYAYLAYMSHARVLNKLGRLDEAYTYTQRAADFCEDRGDEGNLAYVKLKTAEILINNKQYSSAKVPLLESLEVFKKTNHLEHQVEAHAYLETIYEKERNFSKSLAHSRERRVVGLLLAESTRVEEILEARRDYGISRAESKARLAEEVAARAELEGEKAKSKQYALVAGILCIAMLLGITIQRLRSRSLRQEELEAEVASRTAELAAKTKRLEASNRELEKFAYIASHDMKTPLRNVTSFLGLIKRRMPDSAKPAIGEYVDLAQVYARSMHSLVTDVLEFSKLNVDIDGLSEPLNLRNLCAELVTGRSQDLKASGAQIDILGNASLSAPHSFLCQVIGNLIDNALTYNKSTNPRVSIKIYDNEDHVDIVVTDNGIGIAKEYQDKVFELFKRLHTSDEYAGTGLGLASSKKIAERLGGSLTLKSDLGIGSEFTLTLPKVIHDTTIEQSASVKDLVAS